MARIGRIFMGNNIGAHPRDPCAISQFYLWPITNEERVYDIANGLRPCHQTARFPAGSFCPALRGMDISVGRSSLVVTD